jgi:predicted nucleic acid-binding protein
MIAYDTNILIYALEGTSSFTLAAQAIIRQGEQEGAILSLLAWQELMTGAVLNDEQSEKKLAMILNDFCATKFVPVSKSICERAVELTKHHGKSLYGYDAIHIATALENKAKAFITNDKVLLKMKIDGLEIIGL